MVHQVLADQSGSIVRDAFLRAAAVLDIGSSFGVSIAWPAMTKTLAVTLPVPVRGPLSV